MGYETPITIAARRLARDDHRLNVTLFGGHEVQPTFVEYQPDFRFTETDPEGYLLFTVDNTFPLIRYRINDRGHVVTAAELENLLGRDGTNHGADLGAGAAFIALGQRTDIAATFYSLKIFPESVRRLWRIMRSPVPSAGNSTYRLMRTRRTAKRSGCTSSCGLTPPPMRASPRG